MVTNILFEASHVDPDAAATGGAASKGGTEGTGAFVQVSSDVIRVCRTAVQLLVHVGSLGGESGGDKQLGGSEKAKDNAAFLRRVLGGESLKIQTFHLSHLTLTLWSAAEKARPKNSPAASPHHQQPSYSQPMVSSAPTLTSEEAAVCNDLRHLMHEVFKLC